MREAEPTNETSRPEADRGFYLRSLDVQLDKQACSWPLQMNMSTLISTISVPNNKRLSLLCPVTRSSALSDTSGPTEDFMDKDFSRVC